jgi:CRISPR system Cascade subunit CasB
MTNPATSANSAEPNITSASSWRERAHADALEFVKELQILRETDRGRMAELRRNAGETLPGRSTSWFYRYLYPAQRQRNAEIYFLVATLFDLNRKHAVPGDLGKALQVLAQKMRPSDKPEEARKRFRRFHVLLDSEFDTSYDPLNEKMPWQEGGGEVAFRLRQMVKLLASKEVGVDWAELLVDLCEWSQPNKRVQKKWARSFFGGTFSPTTETPADAEPPTEPPTE